MKPLIKFCGITNIEDALYAAELNAWAVGFVFAKSPRKVPEDTVKKIVGKLPPYVSRVGVFVNEDVKNIERIAKSCKLDMAQLHGDESPEFCNEVKKFTKVIKAFRIKDEDGLKILKDYDVTLYLLDTYHSHLRGGIGKTFNWDLAVKAREFGKDIILAGGLSPENIVQAVEKVKPYAVDISTGVEKSPGKKDKKKMKEIISKITGVDNVTE